MTSHSSVEIDDREPPLVVDLDGTLCRTDTLHEMLLREVAHDPAMLRHLPGWLSDGRAALKARLADRGVLNTSELPLNAAVIDLVRQARAEGRTTVLVSAADQRQVDAVAEATGLFDAAHGSDGVRNLKGPEKAAFLRGLYGDRGFDYVGDSSADVAVWQAARTAITVGAPERLRREAEAAADTAEHIGREGSRGRAMLRAMRPHQWSKNALLFLPLLAAQEPGALPQVILGFLAFCLTASAVYVINDLLDLAADRAHPRKRNRPFAAGDLSAATGLAMASGLILVAALLGTATGNPFFIAVLAVYLVLTFAYSLALKRLLMIDVLTLAGLYTIRIVAGGAAGGIDLSPWMLGFSMFLFLSLAAVKRQAELTDQLQTGRASTGRAYETEDLPVLRGIALSAGQSAILVLALYLSTSTVRELYAFPGLLWLVCPLLLYWILRMVMKTHRGEMTDDPIVFAATDRVSLGVVLLIAALVAIAALWPYAVPVI